uniref:KASH domain-containing protein n=1 Tax=Glossina pallidipes TaxID=7398 RepID=A0A1A9ZET1_GLOPL
MKNLTFFGKFPILPFLLKRQALRSSIDEMQQSYDVIAALSYTLDPHSVVTTSSAVSMMLKPSMLGLTYAEVLSGNTSPEIHVKPKKLMAQNYEDKSLESTLTQPATTSHGIDGQNVRPKRKDSKEELSELHSAHRVVTTTTYQTLDAVITLENNPESVITFKKENLGNYEDIPNTAPSSVVTQDFLIKERKEKHMNVPKEQKRGRSPRRKAQYPHVENVTAPIVEDIPDQIATQSPTSNKTVYLSATSAITDRTRSQSPIWVPGSTSYAEVLRGIELERLRQQNLQTANEVILVPQAALAPELVHSQMTNKASKFYSNAQSEASASIVSYPSGSPTAVYEQHVSPTSTSTYIRSYKNDTPMTAEEIQATYLQPDPQLYQSMYENLADSGQWSYVTQTTTPAVVQSTQANNFYEQMMQVQYTQGTALQNQPTYTTGYQYQSNAPQYQMITGYYQAIPAQPQTQIYAPAESTPMYYSPETSQTYNQQYQEETNVNLYEDEDTTEKAQRTNIQAVYEISADSSEKSLDMTTTVLATSAASTPSLVQQIQDQAESMTLYEPQEIAVEEPVTDITFGQFDVNEIESIPIENSPIHCEGDVLDTYETTSERDKEEDNNLYQQEETLYVGESIEQAQITEPKEGQIAGSTYAEVLFGLKNDKHFQPSSQKVHINVTTSSPLNHKTKIETISSTTVITTSNKQRFKSPATEHHKTVSRRDDQIKSSRSQTGDRRKPIREEKVAFEQQKDSIVYGEISVESHTPILSTGETIDTQPTTKIKQTKAKKSKKPKDPLEKNSLEDFLNNEKQFSSSSFTKSDKKFEKKEKKELRKRKSSEAIEDNPLKKLEKTDEIEGKIYQEETTPTTTFKKDKKDKKKTPNEENTSPVMKCIKADQSAFVHDLDQTGDTLKTESSSKRSKSKAKQKIRSKHSNETTEKAFATDEITQQHTVFEELQKVRDDEENIPSLSDEKTNELLIGNEKSKKRSLKDKSTENTLVVLDQQHNETKTALVDFIEAEKQTVKTVLNKKEKLKSKKTTGGDVSKSVENDVKKVKRKTKQKVDAAPTREVEEEIIIVERMTPAISSKEFSEIVASRQNFANERLSDLDGNDRTEQEIMISEISEDLDAKNDPENASPSLCEEIILAESEQTATVIQEDERITKRLSQESPKEIFSPPLTKPPKNSSVFAEVTENLREPIGKVEDIYVSCERKLTDQVSESKIFEPAKDPLNTAEIKRAPFDESNQLQNQPFAAPLAEFASAPSALQAHNEEDLGTIVSEEILIIICTKTLEKIVTFGSILNTITRTSTVTRRILKSFINGSEQILDESVDESAPHEYVTTEKLDSTTYPGGIITKTVTTTTRRTIKRRTESGKEVTEVFINEEPQAISDISKEITCETRQEHMKPAQRESGDSVKTHVSTDTQKEAMGNEKYFDEETTESIKKGMDPQPLSEESPELKKPLDDIFSDSNFDKDKASRTLEIMPNCAAELVAGDKDGRVIQESVGLESQVSQKLDQSIDPSEGNSATLQVLRGGTISRTLTTLTKRLLTRVNERGEEVIEEVIDDDPQIVQEITELPSETTLVRPGDFDENLTSSQVIRGATITRTLTTTTKHIIKRINEKGEEVVEEVYADEPLVQQHIDQVPMKTNEFLLDSTPLNNADLNTTSRIIQGGTITRTLTTTTKRVVKYIDEDGQQIVEEVGADEPVISQEITILPSISQISSEKEAATSAVELGRGGAITKTLTTITKRIIKRINEQGEEIIEEVVGENPVTTQEVTAVPADAEVSDKALSESGITKTVTTITKRIMKRSDGKGDIDEETGEQTECIEEPDKAYYSPLQPYDDVKKEDSHRTEYTKEQTSFENDELRLKSPPVEKITEPLTVTSATMSSPTKEVNDGEVVKTTTIKTTKVVKKITQDEKSDNENEIKAIEAPIALEVSKEVTEDITPQHKLEIPSKDEDISIQAHIAQLPDKHANESIGEGVLKKAIIRTTKIVKKISQNSDSAIVSAAEAPENPHKVSSTDTAMEDRECENNSKETGVVKTTTVRTTKIVKRKPQVSEIAEDTAVGYIDNSITEQEPSSAITEEPKEVVSIANQIDGTIMKTTTIRTMKIIKKVPQDDIIPEEANKLIPVPSIAPQQTFTNELETKTKFTIEPSSPIESSNFKGIELTNVEHTLTKSDLETATTTSLTKPETVQNQRNVEQEHNVNYRSICQTGPLHKIDLITHEEKFKTPVVKIHLEFPEVSLHVTETISKSLETPEEIITVDQALGNEGKTEFDFTNSGEITENLEEAIVERKSLENVREIEKEVLSASDMTPEDQELFEEIQRKLSKKDKKKRPAIPEEFLKVESYKESLLNSPLAFAQPTNNLIAEMQSVERTIVTPSASITKSGPQNQEEVQVDTRILTNEIVNTKQFEPVKLSDVMFGAISEVQTSVKPATNLINLCPSASYFEIPKYYLPQLFIVERNYHILKNLSTSAIKTRIEDTAVPSTIAAATEAQPHVRNSSEETCHNFEIPKYDSKDISRAENKMISLFSSSESKVENITEKREEQNTQVVPDKPYSAPLQPFKEIKSSPRSDDDYDNAEISLQDDGDIEMELVELEDNVEKVQGDSYYNFEIPKYDSIALNKAENEMATNLEPGQDVSECKSAISLSEKLTLLRNKSSESSTTISKEEIIIPDKEEKEEHLMTKGLCSPSLQPSKLHTFVPETVQEVDIPLRDTPKFNYIASENLNKEKSNAQSKITDLIENRSKQLQVQKREFDATADHYKFELPKYNTIALQQAEGEFVKLNYLEKANDSLNERPSSFEQVVNIPENEMVGVEQSISEKPHDTLQRVTLQEINVTNKEVEMVEILKQDDTENYINFEIPKYDMKAFEKLENEIFSTLQQIENKATKIVQEEENDQKLNMIPEKLAVVPKSSTTKSEKVLLDNNHFNFDIPKYNRFVLNKAEKELYLNQSRDFNLIKLSTDIPNWRHLVEETREKQSLSDMYSVDGRIRSEADSTAIKPSASIKESEKKISRVQGVDLNYEFILHNFEVPKYNVRDLIEAEKQAITVEVNVFKQAEEQVVPEKPYSAPLQPYLQREEGILQEHSAKLDKEIAPASIETFVTSPRPSADKSQHHEQHLEIIIYDTKGEMELSATSTETSDTFLTTQQIKEIDERGDPNEAFNELSTKDEENPSKSLYAGLPIDETTSAWMEVFDEPMVFSDEDEDEPESCAIPLEQCDALEEISSLVKEDEENNFALTDQTPYKKTQSITEEISKQSSETDATYVMFTDLPVTDSPQPRSWTEASSDKSILSRNHSQMHDEKAVIDTWSSVLEDSVPSIATIALGSKLSPNAPEFMPSHMRPSHLDQTNTFLANEKYYNEFVPKSKQSKDGDLKQKQLSKFKKGQKSSKRLHTPKNLKPDEEVNVLDSNEIVEEKDKTSKLPESMKTEPTPGRAEDLEKSSGNTYAYVVQNKILEREQETLSFHDTIAVTESVGASSIQGNANVQKQKPEDVCHDKSEQDKVTSEKKSPNKEVSTIGSEKSEPETSNKDIEQSLQCTEEPATIFSWASLVQKPGEWIDNTLTKTKSKLAPMEKRNPPDSKAKKKEKKSKEKKSEKSGSPEKSDSPKKSRSPEKISALTSTTSEEEDHADEKGIIVVEQRKKEELLKTSEDNKSTSSWAALVKRPGEWTDEVASRAKSPKELVTPKVTEENKEYKPRANKKKLNSKTDQPKQQPKDLSVVDKDKSQSGNVKLQAEPQTLLFADSRDTKQSLKETGDDSRSKVTDEPHVDQDVNDFSWASLVKKPGVWIDDLVSRKKSPVHLPADIKGEKPEKSSTSIKHSGQRKLRPQRKQEKEANIDEFSLKIDQRFDSSSQPKTIEQTAVDIKVDVQQDSKPLTWAKIASQIDYMTDTVKIKPPKEMKIPLIEPNTPSPKIKKKKETPKIKATLEKEQPEEQEERLPSISGTCPSKFTADFIQAERYYQLPKTFVNANKTAPGSKDEGSKFSSWAEIVDEPIETMSWKDIVDEEYGDEEEIEILLPESGMQITSETPSPGTVTSEISKNERTPCDALTDLVNNREQNVAATVIEETIIKSAPEPSGLMDETSLRSLKETEQEKQVETQELVLKKDSKIVAERSESFNILQTDQYYIQNRAVEQSLESSKVDQTASVENIILIHNDEQVFSARLEPFPQNIANIGEKQQSDLDKKMRTEPCITEEQMSGSLPEETVPELVRSCSTEEQIKEHVARGVDENIPTIQSNVRSKDLIITRQEQVEEKSVETELADKRSDTELRIESTIGWSSIMNVPIAYTNIAEQHPILQGVARTETAVSSSETIPPNVETFIVDPIVGDIAKQKLEEDRSVPYAGLPIDESSNAWMNIDESMAFSDDEDIDSKDLQNQELLEVCSHETNTAKIIGSEIVIKPDNKPSRDTLPKQTAVAEFSEETNKPLSTYAELLVNGSTIKNIPDESMIFSGKGEQGDLQLALNEENVCEKKIMEEDSIGDEEIIPDFSHQHIITFEEQTKSDYAGLPLDESSNAWISVLDEPINFSDDESEEIKEMPKSSENTEKHVYDYEVEKPYQTQLQPIGTTVKAIDDNDEMSDAASVNTSRQVWTPAAVVNATLSTSNTFEKNQETDIETVTEDNYPHASETDKLSSSQDAPAGGVPILSAFELPQLDVPWREITKVEAGVEFCPSQKELLSQRSNKTYASYADILKQTTAFIDLEKNDIQKAETVEKQEEPQCTEKEIGQTTDDILAELEEMMNGKKKKPKKVIRLSSEEREKRKKERQERKSKSAPSLKSLKRQKKKLDKQQAKKGESKECAAAIEITCTGQTTTTCTMSWSDIVSKKTEDFMINDQHDVSAKEKSEKRSDKNLLGGRMDKKSEETITSSKNKKSKKRQIKKDMPEETCKLSDITQSQFESPSESAPKKEFSEKISLEQSWAVLTDEEQFSEEIPSNTESQLTFNTYGAINAGAEEQAKDTSWSDVLRKDNYKTSSDAVAKQTFAFIKAEIEQSANSSNMQIINKKSIKLQNSEKIERSYDDKSFKQSGSSALTSDGKESEWDQFVKPLEKEEIAEELDRYECVELDGRKNVMEVAPETSQNYAEAKAFERSENESAIKKWSDIVLEEDMEASHNGKLSEAEILVTPMQSLDSFEILDPENEISFPIEEKGEKKLKTIEMENERTVSEISDLTHRFGDAERKEEETFVKECEDIDLTLSICKKSTSLHVPNIKSWSDVLKENIEKPFASSAATQPVDIKQKTIDFVQQEQALLKASMKNDNTKTPKQLQDVRLHDQEHLSHLRSPPVKSPSASRETSEESMHSPSAPAIKRDDIEKIATISEKLSTTDVKDQRDAKKKQPKRKKPKTQRSKSPIEEKQGLQDATNETNRNLTDASTIEPVKFELPIPALSLMSWSAILRNNMPSNQDENKLQETTDSKQKTLEFIENEAVSVEADPIQNERVENVEVEKPNEFTTNNIGAEKIVEFENLQCSDDINNSNIYLEVTGKIPESTTVNLSEKKKKEKKSKKVRAGKLAKDEEVEGGAISLPKKVLDISDTMSTSQPSLWSLSKTYAEVVKKSGMSDSRGKISYVADDAARSPSPEVVEIAAKTSDEEVFVSELNETPRVLEESDYETINESTTTLEGMKSPYVSEPKDSFEIEDTLNTQESSISWKDLVDSDMECDTTDQYVPLNESRVGLESTIENIPSITSLTTSCQENKENSVITQWKFISSRSRSNSPRSRSRSNQSRKQKRLEKSKLQTELRASPSNEPIKKIDLQNSRTVEIGWSSAETDDLNKDERYREKHFENVKLDAPEVTVSGPLPISSTNAAQVGISWAAIAAQNVPQPAQKISVLNEAEAALYPDKVVGDVGELKSLVPINLEVERREKKPKQKSKKKSVEAESSYKNISEEALKDFKPMVPGVRISGEELPMLNVTVTQLVASEKAAPVPVEASSITAGVESSPIVVAKDLASLKSSEVSIGGTVTQIPETIRPSIGSNQEEPETILCEQEKVHGDINKIPEITQLIIEGTEEKPREIIMKEKVHVPQLVASEEVVPGTEHRDEESVIPAVVESSPNVITEDFASVISSTVGVGATVAQIPEVIQVSIDDNQEKRDTTSSEQETMHDNVHKIVKITELTINDTQEKTHEIVMKEEVRLSQLVVGEDAVPATEYRVEESVSPAVVKSSPIFVAEDFAHVMCSELAVEGYAAQIPETIQAAIGGNQEVEPETTLHEQERMHSDIHKISEMTQLGAQEKPTEDVVPGMENRAEESDIAAVVESSRIAFVQDLVSAISSEVDVGGTIAQMPPREIATKEKVCDSKVKGYETQSNECEEQNIRLLKKAKSDNDFAFVNSTLIQQFIEAERNSGVSSFSAAIPRTTEATSGEVEEQIAAPDSKELLHELSIAAEGKISVCEITLKVGQEVPAQSFEDIPKSFLIPMKNEEFELPEPVATDGTTKLAKFTSGTIPDIEKRKIVQNAEVEKSSIPELDDQYNKVNENELKEMKLEELKQNLRQELREYSRDKSKIYEDAIDELRSKTTIDKTCDNCVIVQEHPWDSSTQDLLAHNLHLESQSNLRPCHSFQERQLVLLSSRAITVLEDHTASQPSTKALNQSPKTVETALRDVASSVYALDEPQPKSTTAETFANCAIIEMHPSDDIAQDLLAHNLHLENQSDLKSSYSSQEGQLVLLSSCELTESKPRIASQPSSTLNQLPKSEEITLNEIASNDDKLWLTNLQRDDFSKLTFDDRKNLLKSEVSLAVIKTMEAKDEVTMRVEKTIPDDFKTSKVVSESVKDMLILNLFKDSWSEIESKAVEKEGVYEQQKVNVKECKEDKFRNLESKDYQSDDDDDDDDDDNDQPNIFPDTQKYQDDDDRDPGSDSSGCITSSPKPDQLSGSYQRSCSTQYMSTDLPGGLGHWRDQSTYLALEEHGKVEEALEPGEVEASKTVAEIELTANAITPLIESQNLSFPEPTNMSHSIPEFHNNNSSSLNLVSNTTPLASVATITTKLFNKAVQATATVQGTAAVHEAASAIKTSVAASVLPTIEATNEVTKSPATVETTTTITTSTTAAEDKAPLVSAPVAISTQRLPFNCTQTTTTTTTVTDELLQPSMMITPQDPALIRRTTTTTTVTTPGRSGNGLDSDHHILQQRQPMQKVIIELSIRTLLILIIIAFLCGFGLCFWLLNELNWCSRPH